MKLSKGIKAMSQVSVIIPTHNRIHTLERAIKSVLLQTFEAIDIWIIDDGSTDDTEKMVRAIQVTHSHVHYHRFNTQKGVSVARNWGIKCSEGPYLAFLDSDDEWLPERLELQWKLKNGHPQYRLIHGEEIWIRNGVRVNPMRKHQKFGGNIFEKCLPLCLISPSAVLMERSLMEEMGGFREDYPVCEDYDLWLKVTSLYEVGFVDRPILIKYGGHEDQLSRKYVAMDYWRVKSLQQIYLARPDLEEEKKFMVLQETMKKCKILLNGYKKHGNEQQYGEVEKIQLWARELLGGTVLESFNKKEP